MCALLGLGVSGALAETVTWTPGLSFNESTTGNFSTGWFTVVSPINGTLNSFTVNLGTGSGGGISRTDAYLAISSNLKSSTTGFSASDFVAISNESCTTSGSKITLTFNSDAVLNGGSTYYFYWVTESSGVYTTVNQRYYVLSSTQMSVGTVGTTTASYTNYAMPFSATMTIADNKYYRIKALYPDGICYLYSNASNENKIWKNTVAPSVTASRYVWKATLSTGLILQNVGSSRYIPKLTTGSYTGAQVDYLNATNTDDAEKFALEDNNPGSNNQPGFIALKSTTAASDVWLNTATSGNAYVGSHDANPNKSGQFLFYQVKKVTFSLPVAVNGGDAVSTIYVAVDGSDSFTLPAGYLYSVDGAAEVSNTLAASAISAAGTSDMSITVNAEVINATANITNNKLYHIYTYNNGSTEGSTKYYLTSNGQLTSDEASAADFLFTATDGDYYVNAGYAWRISTNDGSSYFTNPDSGTRNQYIHTTTNKRQNWEAQVFYWNGSKYAIRATNSTNGSGYDCNAFWTVTDYNSDGTPEADYDATLDNKNYVWGVEDAGSVTFNLKFQGETLRTMIKKRSDVLGNAVLPTESWNHACCEYSFEPSTIDSETETVDITMTWNVGDLTFSSDYASATWYHMSLHNKWAKYDESINGTKGHPLYTDKNEVNYDVAGFAGMWAFIGNPLDGAYVINREAGDGKVLGWTTPPRMQSTSEGSSKRFVLGKKSNTEFTLCYSGFYVNDYGNEGELKFWNDARGATSDGSAISVEAVSLYELSLIELDEYASEHAEGEYFGVKSSAVTSLRESIRTAKASYNDAAYSAAHSAIETLWPGTDNANVVFPESGCYYIKSAGTRNWGPAYISYSSTGLVTQTSKDLNSIIYLSKESSVYKLSVQGLNLQPFTSHSQQAQVTDVEGCDVTLSPSSTPGMGLIQNSISGTPDYPSYSKYFHENDVRKVVSWEYNAAASTWAIEEVESITVSLNSDGAGNYYATFCAPFSYTVSGATAYTLAVSGEWLVPTAVDGEVAAGTPVLLKGTSETATLSIGSDYATTPVTTTALTGTYTATTIDGDNDYVLGINGGVVGFYHWDSDNLGANRAYLDTPAASGVKGFAINWDFTDGIDAMQVVNGQQTKDAAIYNLAGQRVQKAQKGIYIQNGKKMFVK